MYLNNSGKFNKKSIQEKDSPLKSSSNHIPTTLSEKFNEYLENTTLHGLKYTGDKSISLCERTFFIIAFIIVVLMSAYFITNVYQKWSATPVIIGLNPQQTELKNIPFPAVTICNMNQAKKSVAKNIEDDTLDHELLQSICDRDGTFNSSSAMPGRWSYFRTFLINVSQTCNEMLMSCRFAMKSENCNMLFDTTLTDEGICCTFNSVTPKLMFQNYKESDDMDILNQTNPFIGINWTPEGGFPPHMTPNMFPRPVPGAGSHLGLTMVLDANVDDYYCSSTAGAGFKVLLHNPTETPKIADFGFSVAPGRESRVVVTPKISDASELIRKVARNLRQCVFANEGNLSYFKTYSKKNCEMECESRLTSQYCDCVLYYMPRFSDETKICSRKDSICYDKIKMAVDLSNNDTFSCKCLPGCFEISYDIELSTSHLSEGKFEIRENLFSDKDAKYVKQNVLVVHIYFKMSGFRSFTKGELIGFTDFLSNTGGLLGLFMGFSVLSLVEIFYFMTIRPYYARKRNAAPNKDVGPMRNIQRRKSILNDYNYNYSEKIQHISNANVNYRTVMDQNYTIRGASGKLIKDKSGVKNFLSKRLDEVTQKFTKIGNISNFKRGGDRRDDNRLPPQYPYFN